MRIHELKTWPDRFNDMLSGIKTFELRFNDRNFKVGDILILQEYRQNDGEYTGRTIIRSVIYILEGFGLKDGYCVLGLGMPVVTREMLEKYKPIGCCITRENCCVGCGFEGCFGKECRDCIRRSFDKKDLFQQKGSK